MDHDAVLHTDRVARLGVDGGEQRRTHTERQSGEQRNKGGAEEGKAMREQTRDPREERKARADEDEVHGGLRVVAEVVRVGKRALRQEVLDLLACVLGGIGEDRSDGAELEAKRTLGARARAARLVTTTVVVQSPLVVVLDAVAGGEPTIFYLDMAAKLDQTAESICGPKWAIARDLTIYESGDATTTKGSKVTADRGPPMVSNDFSRGSVLY